MLFNFFFKYGKNNVLSFGFLFSKRKTKQQVSGSLFWFENDIVDVVLSNHFQKQNGAKISIKNMFFLFFFQ